MCALNEDVFLLIGQILYMGRGATKPVLGVSHKVRFKPACSATETSKKMEISFVASLMILSNKQITKALIRLCMGLSVP